MAREESSKEAKKRTKNEKTAIKAALKNNHVKNLHITEQEENKKKANKRHKKTKKRKGAQGEDLNDVICDSNSPNDLNEEMTIPSNSTQQTTNTRGPTTCSGLSFDNGTKLEVKLNAMGQPIGKNSEQLSSFVGCLTRELVPLNYDDWRNIHAVQKNCYWQAILQKFTFNEREPEAKAYVLGEMGRLARANKAKYGKHLDKKPKHIDPVEWEVFVKSRTSKKIKERSKIFKDMKAKQTLRPYRGSRKGFARIEDEVYKKEGSISDDKVRLRTWIRGYEKHGESVEADEIMKKAKEILAAPSESIMMNSNTDEDALSKVLNKRDRHGRITAKGAGACRTKVNAISMTSGKVVELEGNVSILQGEVKDLKSLVEQQTKYINELLKRKDLEVEHNYEDNNDKDEGDRSEDEDEDSGEDEDEDIDADDENSEDEDNIGKDPNIPTNIITNPQCQNGSLSHRSKKCKLLNWAAPNEVVAIGDWITDRPDTNVHFVPLGRFASKVWVTEALKHNAPLFRSNSSMDTVGEAVGAPIAWPTSHIIMLDEEIRSSEESIGARTLSSSSRPTNINA